MAPPRINGKIVMGEKTAGVGRALKGTKIELAPTIGTHLSATNLSIGAKKLGTGKDGFVGVSVKPTTTGTINKKFQAPATFAYRFADGTIVKAQKKSQSSPEMKLQGGERSSEDGGPYAGIQEVVDELVSDFDFYTLNKLAEGHVWHSYVRGMLNSAESFALDHPWVVSGLIRDGAIDEVGNIERVYEIVERLDMAQKPSEIKEILRDAETMISLPEWGMLRNLRPSIGRFIKYHKGEWKISK